jgi:PTS system mannose-specific IIB component
MGVVNLARVDERLIHGQVMTNLSKRSGVNSIFVVDDIVAKDDFMKNLYKSAGSRTGQKTHILTVTKVCEHWINNQFKEYNCILITKSVKVMYELAKYGVPLPELNIGGVAQKGEGILVSKSVYLTKDEMLMLKEMKEQYGVDEIYFQTVPSSSRVEYETVLKKFNI